MLIIPWSAPAAPSLSLVFTGASDASAAVALDLRHIVVADDEDNILRIYRLDVPGAPIGEVDLTAFLAGADDRRPEADLEGAARVGDRIYWITSHGRNRDGKERPSRHAFFATDIVTGPGDDAAAPRTLEAVGQPYRHLARDVVRDPALAFLDLERSLRLGQRLGKKEREVLAPQGRGFNIEGLAAGPDGSLLIGLRNPTYVDPTSGRLLAIVLVLLNPDAVALDGRAAVFGAPLLLDLDGLGVRSLESLASTPGLPPYLVVAGTADGRGRFGFYAWDGGDASPQAWALAPTLPVRFTPEAMLQIPSAAELWLLSDDGMLERTIAAPAECRPGELLKNGKCPNKFLNDRARRTFRALSIRPVE